MSIMLSASTNPPKTKEEMFDYIKKLDKTDVDYIHCDIMDGKFVEAKTFDYHDVKRIKEITTKKLDVHPMIKHPFLYLKRYAKAGADIITVHFEAFKTKNNVIKALNKIRKLGCFAGLSINPSTNVFDILDLIPYCDMILIMSVVPGKSGQEFIGDTYSKLDNLNKFLKKQKLDVFVEVDGGVNLDNIKNLNDLNVNAVVMGSALFKAKNKKAVIDAVHNA